MEKFLVRTNKPTDAPPAAKKLRRYDEAYLQFGFTATADLRPQCVVCAEVLANDSMKPCKLKRHLETKHAGIKNKPAEYFKRKLDGLHQQQATISVHSTVSKQCLEASYVVAKRIGKLGKPHTIAETLILPAAQDMCRIMIGDSAAAKLGAVPLSNDTVARRIVDMSNDIREQLIEFVKNSPYYALQLDESTDIAGQAQLLTYVRYLRDKAIEEDVLFCRPLQSHTTGEAIFNVLDIFIRENGLAWDRCVGLCTDGAQAMTGRERGLAARVQQVAPLVKWTHCMVHREALAAKKMPVLFDSVLNQSVKMINLIKSRPLNTRLFGVLCQEMGSGHEQLLLHTEVRWLSRGRVLQRLYELREEVKWFLTEIKSDLAKHLDDTMWLASLSYLVDIFDRLNGLNLSLQGRETHILLLADKVHAFTQKLDLWHGRISRGNCDMFPSLADFITDAGTSHDFSSLFQSASGHLSAMRKQFATYFKEDYSSFAWVRDPFVCTANELSIDMQEQLIELKSDSRLKELFSSCPLSSFWAALMQEYPELCDVAFKILLPFASTYLCEAGFSKMTALKTKYRNRAQIEDDLRLCLSNIEPRIEDLCKAKQAQVSH
ncbi:Zinc finger BED domain-containing protein 5 [Labeo rohita]|uniref:Zinc finger BED domain-containing protein 5 n=1 Tax=Labeo rohita TaxID=84645 RepID=A0ABQ8L7I5_LABRO|nr:zinc finger BED domain-containing protein 5 [Labeo rohita]KAI2646701.1 Zinc finger BED domain-containing protein 5 [Labeo rohita]